MSQQFDGDLQQGNDVVLLLSAGLQERVEELKQVLQEDKSTREMLKVRYVQLNSSHYNMYSAHTK